jgi:4-amino-4-deoxy-L-arabinose transferase-like glycosyltransferase
VTTGDAGAEHRTNGGHGRMPRRVLLLLVAVLCALVAALVILAAVPPVSRDALTHHLLVPKLYLACGGICEIPHVRFSYYPMNLDLLYLLPLYFGNDILPKYIHMAFGLATAWLIFAYLKKRLGTAYGILGALLFLSLPVIVRLSITAYVDLGLVFFTTAALLALLEWSETGFRFRHLVLAGIGCGLALGTKYNGLIVFFLLTLFVPIAFLRGRGDDPHRSVRGMGYAVCFAAVSLAVFSPWMVRNAIWKGNPLYPFYGSLLKMPGPAGRAVAPSPAKKKVAGRLDHFTYRRAAFGESRWQIAAIPLRIFFQGRDDNPRYFDGQLNPCLLVFPLIAVGFVRRGPPGIRRETWALALFAALFLLFAFFGTDMRIRYIAPILPPLVILTVFGIHHLAVAAGGIDGTGLRRVARGGGAVLAVAFLLPNLLYVVKQFDRVRPFSYLGGAVTRGAYIQHHRPEYAVMAHANRHLPPNAKILGLFLGGRLYYSDRQTVDNARLFFKLVRRASSPAGLHRSLQTSGFSHLLARYDLMGRWIEDNFDAGQKEMLDRFFRTRVKVVASQGGYGLLALAGAG